jgi:hypothetical protein
MDEISELLGRHLKNASLETVRAPPNTNSMNVICDEYTDEHAKKCSHNQKQ